MSKVWEPVEDGFTYKEGMNYGEGELEVEGHLISISAESGYIWGTASLPDNLRLCRLVDAPEVHTAQEFYTEVMRRANEELGELDYPLEVWDQTYGSHTQELAEEWGLTSE